MSMAQVTCKPARVLASSGDRVYLGYLESSLWQAYGERQRR